MAEVCGAWSIKTSLHVMSGNGRSGRVTDYETRTNIYLCRVEWMRWGSLLVESPFGSSKQIDVLSLPQWPNGENHFREMPTKRPRGFPMQAHLSRRIGYHHQWRIVPPDG